ncbi:MAG: hypothetical protein Q9219_007144 [cf. Caloplaca sp. 3 TL-2023]
MPGKTIISVGNPPHEGEMGPLQDRVWAFQEWLLSRRLIQFSHDEIRWECYCLAASQLYPEGPTEDDMDEGGLTVKRIMVSLSDKKLAVDALWERVRQEYSAKKLTRPTDRLTAFSGIARMAHKVLKSAPEEYCVGLRKPMLLTELLWDSPVDQAGVRPLGVYVAPTWSWASLNGRFWRSQKVSEKGQWLVDVIETRIHHVEDESGPVHGGCLVLRCILCPVILTVVEEDPDCFSIKFHWRLTHINGALVNYLSWVDLDYHEPAGSGNFACQCRCYFMPMRENHEDGPKSDLHGMLLKPSELSNGQYYRVGLLTVGVDGGVPAIMESILQGQDRESETLYLDERESGFGLIEIL